MRDSQIWVCLCHWSCSPPVTPRSRCSHGVNSKVFGRGIQKSEIAETSMAAHSGDLIGVRKRACHCISGGPGQGAMREVTSGAASLTHSETVGNAEIRIRKGRVMTIGRHQAPRKEMSDSGIYGPVIV